MPKKEFGKIHCFSCAADVMPKQTVYIHFTSNDGKKKLNTPRIASRCSKCGGKISGFIRNDENYIRRLTKKYSDNEIKVEIEQ